MTGETDVAQLARLFRFEERLHGAALGKDPVRVVVAQDFMMLDEVDAIRAHALQGGIDLRRCLGLGAAVHLGHEEYAVTVAALVECYAHAQFGAALVVVPAIVHEIDATVDALVDQPHRFVVGHRVLADVEAAHADRRDHLVGPAEAAIEHVAAPLAWIGHERQCRRVRDPRHRQRRAHQGRRGSRRVLLHRTSPKILPRKAGARREVSYWPAISLAC